MPANKHSSNDEEINMNEVLQTINEFANNVYQKFAEIDKRFDNVDKRFENIEKRLDNIEDQLEVIDNRFGNMEGKLTHFVTKEYLDDKLADFRDENRVFHHQLLNTLERKNVLNQSEYSQLHKLA